MWLAKNPSQADALVGALVTAASGVLAPDYCAPTAAAAANGGPNAAADGVETPRCSVYRASLQLLSAVVAVVRSPCLWRSPTWLQLFDSVHDMTYLPPIVRFCFVFLFGKIPVWDNLSNQVYVGLVIMHALKLTRAHEVGNSCRYLSLIDCRRGFGRPPRSV